MTDCGVDPIVPFHIEILRMKFGVMRNISSASIALEVSQSCNGWLNFSAFQNMPVIFVTFSTFHLLMFALKFFANENIFSIFSTFEVSHVPMF